MFAMTKGKKMKLLSSFKALGNPVRLDIIHFLGSGEKCVCKIFTHLNLPQNLVSHHLGILRESGLIKSRKEGKWVHCSLDLECLSNLKSFLGNFDQDQNTN